MVLCLLLFILNVRDVHFILNCRFYVFCNSYITACKYQAVTFVIL